MGTSPAVVPKDDAREPPSLRCDPEIADKWTVEIWERALAEWNLQGKKYLRIIAKDSEVPLGVLRVRPIPGPPGYHVTVSSEAELRNMPTAETPLRLQEAEEKEFTEYQAKRLKPARDLALAGLVCLLIAGLIQAFWDIGKVAPWIPYDPWAAVASMVIKAAAFVAGAVITYRTSRPQP